MVVFNDYPVLFYQISSCPILRLGYFLFFSPSSILAGQFRGQRNMADYSPWGRKRVRHNFEAEQQ